MSDIFFKNIAIFGLGKSGVSLKNFLQENNFEHKIYLFEDNSEKLSQFESEKNIIICSPENADWRNIDYLMVSPGIDKNHSLLKHIENTKITIDIELFYLVVSQQNPNAKFIGITGTNGKSTTTALIYHVMKNVGINVEMGGNIGVPIFDLRTNADFYVLEISSYQLDLLKRIRLHYGILTNITPDHLDRYDFKMENYVNSKKHIIDLSDNLVISVNNENTRKIADELISKNTNNLFITSINKNADVDYFYDFDFETKLLGNHNRENIVNCLALCNLIGINNQQITENIKTFEPLSHRLQFIGEINNIKFINDSKATTGEAVVSAINSFENNEELHLILGGIAKSDGLIPLTNVLHKIDKFYLIGQSSDEFYEFLSNYDRKDDVFLCENLENACEIALKFCQSITKCDTIRIILFSPACASFDQFANFEDRGKKFIEIINNLMKRL